MPIRAILFDLGDTLWHFPNSPGTAAFIAEAARRVESRLQTWGLCDGVSCGDLAAAILAADREQTRAAERSHGRSPDFSALVRTCAAEYGVTLDAEQAAALWDAWNLGGEFLGRAVFPDSVPLLRELRRRGYRLGSVTNRSLGGERFRAELRSAGMLELFDVLAVSSDDGWLKPHPALFRRALDALGVPPHQAVMVGDSLQADVIGAKALGMIAVWKRPPHARQEPATLPDGTPVTPDYTIDHPAELLRLPIFEEDAAATR